MTKDKVEILQDGKIIEQFEDAMIDLESFTYLKFLGEKEAKSYLVFNSYSGGAHCCTSLTIYELQPKLKKILKHSGNTGGIIMEKTPDGEYYFNVGDDSFLYWHTYYADSARINLNMSKNANNKLEVIEFTRFCEGNLKK